MSSIVAPMMVSRIELVGAIIVAVMVMIMIQFVVITFIAYHFLYLYALSHHLAEEGRVCITYYSRAQAASDLIGVLN